MWRREDFFDTHVLDPMPKPIAIDFIAVTKQELWRGVPRKGFHDLLCRPCRAWVFSNAEMDDTAALDRQKEQHVKNLESDRGYHEKIDGDDVFRVILQKRAPRRGRRLSNPYAILVNSGFRRRDPEFRQLPHDPR